MQGGRNTQRKRWKILFHRKNISFIMSFFSRIYQCFRISNKLSKYYYAHFCRWECWNTKRDTTFHSYTLNPWQCMGQSPGLLILCEPLDTLSAWLKEPPSVSEDSFVKYNFAKDCWLDFTCSTSKSNFFPLFLFPRFLTSQYVLGLASESLEFQPNMDYGSDSTNYN